MPYPPLELLLLRGYFLHIDEEMISAAIYVLALVESVMLSHAWVRVCMSRVVGHSQRFYWTSQTQARERDGRGAERRGEDHIKHDAVCWRPNIKAAARL